MTSEGLLTLLDQGARAALRAGAGLPATRRAEPPAQLADEGMGLRTMEALAAYATAERQLRLGRTRPGWTTFGVASEVRAEVAGMLCREPRRRALLLAETALHLALARRGQGMPSDRQSLMRAAQEAEEALAGGAIQAGPGPRLPDWLRQADDPAVCVRRLAALAAGAGEERAPPAPERS